MCWCLSREALASRMLLVTFPVYFQRQCGSFSETPLAWLHREIIELDMRRFQRASPLWESARALKSPREDLLSGSRENKANALVTSPSFKTKSKHPLFILKAWFSLTFFAGFQILTN